MVKSILCTRIAIAAIMCFCFYSCSTNINHKFPDSLGNVDIINGEVEYREIKEAPVRKNPKELRVQVAAVYKSQLGVRELTGKNDGRDVEKYLKSVGLGKGYAWCAAFVKWVFDQVGIVTTITAWSPTAHNKNNICYANRKIIKTPQQGDVFTLYYNSKGRIGHTGFFDHFTNEGMTANYEGNTNSSKSPEGDGVYLIFRPLNTIHSITSWID